jgi:hypothetical protein
MRIATVVFNVALFLFTVVVLVTDGLSNEVAYNLLALLLLAVPALTVVVLGRRMRGASLDLYLRWSAVVCNVALAGFSYWSIASQYPHPKEDGIVAFMLLTMVTPILSALVVFESLKKQPARPA